MTTKALLQDILKKASVTPLLDDVVVPLFFRLGNEVDRSDLRNLLQQKPFIRIFDTIDQQLRELVKSFYPKKTLVADEIERLVNDHLTGIPKLEYGVWVY